MTTDCYDEILNITGDDILVRKENANYCRAICLEQRLAIALR